MATIRAYTTIEQSRKLAEILPLESSDMYYQYVLPKSDKIRHNPEVGNPTNTLKWYNEGYVFSGKEPITVDEFCVPCWSLASLLGVLPEIDGSPLNIERVKAEDGYDGYYYHIEYKDKILIPYSKNPVDACVAMVKKLNELNLL